MIPSVSCLTSSASKRRCSSVICSVMAAPFGEWLRENFHSIWMRAASYFSPSSFPLNGIRLLGGGDSSAIRLSITEKVLCAFSTMNWCVSRQLSSSFRSSGNSIAVALHSPSWRASSANVWRRSTSIIFIFCAAVICFSQEAKSKARQMISRMFFTRIFQF